eukprot:scaffold35115_cov153-Amphora_coffeaeformis.AAC.1
MGEDAFGFGSDPFEVMGVSARSMDEFKSVNSSSTAATRSTTSSRSSRNSSSGGGGSSGDRNRGVRHSNSGERDAFGSSDPFAQPPAPAPVAAPPPQRAQRARRRASIGVAAALPAQLAPAPQTDISGHFEKESGGDHRRSRSADADVQSTASGFKNKRTQNIRRGRRASLATAGISSRSFDSAPPSRHHSKPAAASSSFDAFGSSDPFASNDAFGGSNDQDYGYGYEDQGTPDYGYGYEDAGPSSKGGDGFSDFSPFGGGADDGFGSPTKSSSSSGRQSSRPSALGSHSRGGRDMTIKTPKRSSCLGVGASQEQKYSAPSAPSSSITGGLDVDLDPFDFSTTAAPASSAAASRTTNILLPVTAAPVEKAHRPRRRASLMGAMSGAISGTVGAVTAIADVGGAIGGAAVGTITGSSGKNSGEKLSDDKKSRRSGTGKTSSSKPRKKSNDGAAGPSS